MLNPPRWLWRLTALPIVLSLAVGVLMSISVGPGSPFFLAVALLAFLPLAGRDTLQLGGLCVLTGVVQVGVGLLPFLILYTVSGGALILVGLIAFLARAPAEGIPAGTR